MKREDISEAVGNINTKYIQEAAPNIRVKKKPAFTVLCNSQWYFAERT